MTYVLPWRDAIAFAFVVLVATRVLMGRWPWSGR